MIFIRFNFTLFLTFILIVAISLINPSFANSQNYKSIYGDVPDKIVVYGEYPIERDIETPFDEGEEPEQKSSNIIDYSGGKDYKDKALIDAIHILSANVYGYTFTYKPGSKLMKTDEVFEIRLKGQIPQSAVDILASGNLGKIYRVKIAFFLTPSVNKWITAFRSRMLKLTEAEGTSDFYQGWEGRNVAYRNALRNLVLIEAKRQLSSKPLKIKGDILLDGNPQFNVGAGRYYCKIKGWVNIVDVVTYD